MTASLALLIAVAAAYLAAHVFFDWLGKRYLVVSGAEYLVLGVLLGPRVTGILDARLVDSLSPVLTLALGWIGTVIGMQFELRTLLAIPARTFRIAFAESALTFATVGGLEFIAARWLFASTDMAVVLGCVLGALAIASSGVGVNLVAKVLEADTPIVRQLRLSTQINALVAIAIFAVLLCVRHQPLPVVRPLTPTEWVAVSIAIGVVGGTLFHVFLGDAYDSDRLFVSLVGGIVMVSGAATYLRLSPLFSSVLFGMILVNTTNRPEVLIGTLTRVERPFYLVLLLFGGANWRPSQHAWVLAVLLYIVARVAAKIGGSRLAARANGALPELGENWGVALLGQGRVAVAIGLTYLHQENSLFPNVVFTAAILSIVLTEFFSARTTRAVVAVS
ncbi:MAG TPA: hypothetical protein VHB25_09155 [Gemmatimonadaceae bacterium]|nr:hypothetical protein [Gemmatimonadaceae bacterium]